jgi:hypothetical protein
MTEMVPSGLMRGRWRRSQGLAREAPATERAGEQIGLAYSHRASAPLYGCSDLAGREEKPSRSNLN